MRILDLTLPTPAENLACDEALLELCEAGGLDGVLRFWESRVHFVVIGYANRVRVEADSERCRESGIPILRRCTGGGAVVQGPGCLNYTLVLPIRMHPGLETICATNRFILDRHRAVFQELVDRSTMNKPPGVVTVEGHSDLALNGLKFSGNAQRRARECILFHGTFLLDFNISLISRLLPMPSRQPDYRRRRSHDEFLANLHLPGVNIQSALRDAWNCGEPLEPIPLESIQLLARDKYATHQWTWKF